MPAIELRSLTSSRVLLVSLSPHLVRLFSFYFAGNVRNTVFNCILLRENIVVAAVLFLYSLLLQQFHSFIPANSFRGYIQMTIAK